ncbi:hypothetical protein O7635_03855 [Asanoa sp. WMMD1127]|uniref:hypothetical protein n=1 Tax=Asanoa sp. WMMD1127 TaxID=3016107 RepID=UPI002415D381|nr:hypothetical protein [Asanoa sp. WMMD1127]MDG4820988.1 hypothetical protein [Asanoa sp. WMMD1127]
MSRLVMALLTESEYRATMDPHPVEVGPDEAPPFDFWDYFESIPQDDCDGHDFSSGTVSYAWTMPATDCQHVLIRCETANVFLVLILDLERDQVLGHYLLDLGNLYGLT